MGMREAASAVNRFGLGARPGELNAAADDPRGWLLAQLRPDPDAAARFAKLPSSLDYLRRENDFRGMRRTERRARMRAPDATASEGMAQRGEQDVVKQFVANYKQAFGDDRLAEIDVRYRQALTTPAGFTERLVRFWSNHFAISVDKRPAALFAGAIEREAIRPNVFGDFADLLLAAETHPGMLRYLDNTTSIGEQSAFARRAARRADTDNSTRPSRDFGLNENLAREILELHTLGVDGGYGQDDVIELARAITGWGVPMRRDFSRGMVSRAFVFRDIAHEPGARIFLGKTYAEGGFEQGRAMLGDLSRRPATARHLAFKLARHFIADQPPQALVERMAAAYLDSGGQLPALYRTLIDSPQAWTEDARKFKTPDDFVVSALRAAAIPQVEPKLLIGLLRQLGQPPFMPRSPAGFADTAGDWSGPDALFKRVQVAQALAERLPRQRPPLQLAQTALGPGLDPQTRTAIMRAESPQQGTALLLASPVFQWRV